MYESKDEYKLVKTIEAPGQYVDFTKIRISSNDQLVAVSTQKKLLILTQPASLALEPEQVIDIYLPTFTLSPVDGGVFFSSAAGKGVIGSPCPVKSYFNLATKQCETCI